MLWLLIKSLWVKSTPIFKGDPKEDPITFEKKALDYMEASGIPEDEQTDEFKNCLEGKAHVWYDKIEVPDDWFCIYARASEDWYRQWNKLSFDPNSDADIEEFISEVKSLQTLLDLPNWLVVTTLKEKFPSHRVHFLNVNTVRGMFEMLRTMFPNFPPAASPLSSHKAIANG